MKKILFIFMAKSSDDRSAWSGTMYQSFTGLQRAGYQVDYLYALRDYHENFLDKLLCTYWLRIPAKFGKNMRMDEAFYTKRICKQTLRNFDYSPYDVIFIPTHIAIVNALPKRTKAKVVHLVDATVDSLFDYYSEFSNLVFHNYWEAHLLGKYAFRRSDLIISSSDWCKQNAIKTYGINAAKIAVIEFGANIDYNDVPALPKNRISDSLQIYWSGVNWKRKGGDIAIACCDELIRRGYQISFNITGMRDLPKEVLARPYVKNYGFLNKNKPKEYQRIIQIMKEQDIFLFPSRAECSSIALCEANGFGLPCFAYDTGGTRNYVVDGENGYVLPLHSDGIAFAEKIISCLEKKELARLSQGAVKRYKEKLNWNVWSERVKDVIEEL